MSAVDARALEGIYAGGDDPWDFRTSAYEQRKFEATAAALPRTRYRSGLEVGCGNGELARHLAPRCDRYAGLDAVDSALEAARRAVPGAAFHRGFLPCELPDGDHDLVVLSEVLYFLDAGGIDALAAQIDRRWPAADVVCVTWRGPSGNPLEGEAALALFLAAVEGRTAATARLERGFRIDVLSPCAADGWRAAG
ncbi:nodulation S family protein [Jannaschia sp. W003]|uniref:nodulation S family protein n=1 Tax=Jannaschia sp. W003 TaxID=2867012 RepID=UPI0021A4862B|nr:nodulation S family protein [Jannaschia sp. W003]UWQ19967.1 nodulation S family protein [Jannaschia sp. W003]